VRDGIWVVAHLHAGKRGSLEEQLVALAGALALRGVPATFVFCQEPARWVGEAFAAHGARVRWLDYGRPLEAARRLAAWLSAEPASLVHFHFVRAYSPLVAAARLSGASVAVHEHIALEHGAPSREPVKAARGRALNFLAHLRIAVSHFVARTLREVDRVPAARISVVENGVDLARFRDATGERVREELHLDGASALACISRLDPQKGVETAVHSIAFTRDAHLLLAGQGPLMARLREIAAADGSTARVHLLGLRNDVEQIVAAADAVIVPSHWDEAFGLAVVEGMAAGKPVIVSRSGAMPDLVGECGLVVDKRDAAGLGHAAQRLCDDDVLARRLGDAGRARAQARFGLDRWLAEMLAVYQSLCPLLDLARAAA
jgi:glycosyltransferase involved in cell wall biosynthesis